jgi:hypothetical protein
MSVALTPISSNRKTGPMPVSYSTKEWCPDDCPLKAAGCYAKHGHTGIHWRKVTAGERGTDWDTFVSKVRHLPKGGIWRHNVAGDLPAKDGVIDSDMVRQLIKANTGKGGFTYTHHDMVKNAGIIASSNHNGFTVNLSSNNVTEADTMAEMDIAPVVTLLPTGSKKVTFTPKGRKVVRCPAETSEKVTCQSCRLCQKTDRPIIGFTPHGSGKKVTQEIAQNV